MTHYRYNPEYFQPFDSWYEFTYDDAQNIATLMGWNIERIYFSGFWSQGDGACFIGTLGYAKGCAKAVKSYAPQDSTLHAIAERWQALQRSQFYSISATVSHIGRYHHEFSTAFEWEDSRHSYGDTSDSFDMDEAEDIAREFMRWIYRQLEREYEFQVAWNHAQAWQDAAQSAHDARLAARQAVVDYRATLASPCAATLPASTLHAAKSLIRDALREYRRACSKFETLADEFHYYQDGKSIDIATFAREHC